MFGTQRNGTRVPTVVEGESRTKQSMRDECDINRIIARYHKTGVVTHINPREPLFGDFTGVGDLQEALARVERAREMFMRLPAGVRDRFDNDPESFVEFVQEAKSADLEALGLSVPREVKQEEVKAAEAAVKGVEPPVTPA